MDKQPRRVHCPRCPDKTTYQDHRCASLSLPYLHSFLTQQHLGICFGHQIIARALGGECVPNGGRWELGPTPLRLTDLGKRIFNSDELVGPAHITLSFASLFFLCTSLRCPCFFFYRFLSLLVRVQFVSSLLLSPFCCGVPMSQSWRLRPL